MKDIFNIDFQGWRELVGGDNQQRQPLELVANVFDEYRGYTEGRVRPTYCKVTLTKDGRKPATLEVEDDGAGFDEVSDIWTFFRSTAKRRNADVAGRFNAGEKQLLAIAKTATIVTNNHTITFANGKRDVTKHKSIKHKGTKITATFVWNNQQVEEITALFKDVVTPHGLTYTVNGTSVDAKKHDNLCRAKLPTVILNDIDGIVALRKSTRVTDIEVYKNTEKPMLYELGLPICELGLEFPHSLNVMQKIPVPLSRDMVDVKYIQRLIGEVLKQTALDGDVIVDENHSQASFMKDALEYVDDADAMRSIVGKVHSNSVRWSSDTRANANAVDEGRALLARGTFGSKASVLLDNEKIIPTSHQMYGETTSSSLAKIEQAQIVVCPNCTHEFEIVQKMQF